MTDVPTLTEVTTTVDTGYPDDPILGAVPGAREDVTTGLYRAAIGPMCPDFYLPIFSRFEAAGKPGLSWNSAASLLTFNWLVFRQLWTAALAYVGIVAAVGLLVFGIGRLVFQMSDEVSLVLLLIFGLAAFIAPGLLGNVLLHKQCRARMEKALADNPTLTDAMAQLQRQASSRRRLLWLALGNVGALGLAALLYMQMSALTTMTAMPQGAADARQTVSGLATDANGPLVGESAASAAAPTLAAVSESALPASPAPGAAVSEPASAASATPVAAAASTPAAPMAPEQSPPKAPSLASTPPAVQTTATAPPPPASPKPSAQAATPKKAAASAPPKAAAKTTAASAAPAAAAPTSKTTAQALPQALFYINVGLFSKPENASRVHAQLLEANMPSVMKELKTTQARQIRVRVGPYASEEKAEAAAQKIKAMQFEAGIIQK